MPASNSIKLHSLPPTLNNVLKLFSRRLSQFKAESRRSYRKAFSSLQIFLISNYDLSVPLSETILANWIADNALKGLSKTTNSFYLDKIASLYTKTLPWLTVDESEIFKRLKLNFKTIDWSYDYASMINSLLKKAMTLPDTELIIDESSSVGTKALWAAVALHCGVSGDRVKAIAGDKIPHFDFLKICHKADIPDEEKKIIVEAAVRKFRYEVPEWFAMRLRPGVSYDMLLQRFHNLNDSVKMPELFYPSEEIAIQMGRKIVWKGKPMIHNVVFFKTGRSEVYPLFTHLYDLAWCYRRPGKGMRKYAAIPDKAMEDFKLALGILGPEFEVVPAGEMVLKPGDEVVIVSGDYARQHGKILKSAPDDNGHKIYRVTLLNSAGRWDIGIDARLLKPSV